MAVAEQMLRSNPAEAGIDEGLLVRAIEACLECTQTCTSCGDACGAMEGMERCTRLCNDCADICHVASRVLSRKTAFQPDLVREAIQACSRLSPACAEDCASHDAEHCKVCGDACRRCVEACDDVVAALG